MPRAISEFLGANTRIASSRSREGWRSLDFTAELWKHPAGCSSWCLHPTDVSLTGERGTNQGGRPARSRRHRETLRPEAKRQPAPTHNDRLLNKVPNTRTQRAQCIHGIVDFGLFFNVISRSMKQIKCPQNQSHSASASSCGSLTQTAGWSAKPLKNAIREGCLSGSMLRNDLPTHLEGMTNLRLDQLGVGVCLVTERS